MKFSLKSLRKPLLWIGTPLLIYALLGFLILPAIVKPQAEQILAETLKRRVTIGKIAFNPFLLKAEVRDFSLMENDAAFVRFAGLTIDLELASLWRRGPVVREVTLENPQIRVVRLSADRYNFSDLLDRPQNAPAQESGPLPRFSINNIRILGGDLIFDDRHLKSRQEISDLALAIPFVSTLPDMLDDFVEPGLSGKLNGRPFALTGKTKPFEDSRETSLSLKLDHLNLPDYVAYVPLTDGVHLPSGLLSADLNLVFRQGRGEQTVLVQGGIALEQLALKQGKETIFSLPAFRIDGLALDLTRQNIELARISATDGDVRVVRNKEGAINFTRLIASQPASQSAQAAPQPSATPAWKVRIGEFALDNFAVSFVDQTLPRAVPIALHQLALKVSGIDTTPATPAKARFFSPSRQARADGGGWRICATAVCGQVVGGSARAGCSIQPALFHAMAQYQLGQWLCRSQRRTGAGHTAGTDRPLSRPVRHHRFPRDRQDFRAGFSEMARARIQGYRHRPRPAQGLGG
jgi:hypothetical protein